MDLSDFPLGRPPFDSAMAAGLPASSAKSSLTTQAASIQTILFA